MSARPGLLDEPGGLREREPAAPGQVDVLRGQGEGVPVAERERTRRRCRAGRWWSPPRRPRARGRRGPPCSQRRRAARRGTGRSGAGCPPPARRWRPGRRPGCAAARTAACSTSRRSGRPWVDCAPRGGRWEDGPRAAPTRPRLRRHRLPRLGDPAGAADRAGAARGGARPGAPRRDRLRHLRGPHGHRCARPRPGGPPRRGPGRAGRVRGPEHRPAHRRAAAPPQRGAARRRAGARAARRTGGVRRAVLRGLAPLRLPDRRRPRPRRPARTARRARLATPAGPGRHEHGSVPSHRGARLRGVLQEAGGCDDRPDAARPLLGT